jgi:hypothetical protein
MPVEVGTGPLVVHRSARICVARVGRFARTTITGMTSLLDPLPDEGQQLVDLVAHVYAMTGKWPVWQFVAQQAFGKYGIDAEALFAACRNGKDPASPATRRSGRSLLRQETRHQILRRVLS